MHQHTVGRLSWIQITDQVITAGDVNISDPFGVSIVMTVITVSVNLITIVLWWGTVSEQEIIDFLYCIWWHRVHAFCGHFISPHTLCSNLENQYLRRSIVDTLKRMWIIPIVPHWDGFSECLCSCFYSP